jgi:hypothetical protein
VLDLEVDGSDSVPDAISYHLMQSFRAKSLATEFRANVEFIYERVSAVKLEAKSKGQDEKTNRLPVHSTSVRMYQTVFLLPAIDPW